jgi:hypothetical protein
MLFHSDVFGRRVDVSNGPENDNGQANANRREWVEKALDGVSDT